MVFNISMICCCFLSLFTFCAPAKNNNVHLAILPRPSHLIEYFYCAFILAVSFPRVSPGDPMGRRLESESLPSHLAHVVPGNVTESLDSFPWQQATPPQRTLLAFLSKKLCSIFEIQGIFIINFNTLRCTVTIERPRTFHSPGMGRQLLPAHEGGEMRVRGKASRCCGIVCVAGRTQKE